MSSFVVGSKTLSIISSFITLQLNHGFNNTGIYYDFDGQTSIFTDAYVSGCYQEERIFNILLAENIKAVNGRYNTAETIADYSAHKFTEYSFTRIEYGRDAYLMLYNALACYLYQICEDATINGAIYTALNDLKHGVACQLVSKLSENINYVWGD